jgi:hypothetical protein
MLAKPKDTLGLIFVIGQLPEKILRDSGGASPQLAARIKHPSPSERELRRWRATLCEKIRRRSAKFGGPTSHPTFLVLAE